MKITMRDACERRGFPMTAAIREDPSNDPGSLPPDDLRPDERGLARQAAAFVGLAIALSWVPWFIVVATVGDLTATATSMVLWGLGGLGPAVAAVIVVSVGHGRQGLRQLADGLLRWRLGVWYLLLLASLPVAVLAVLAAVATGPAELDLAGMSRWYLLPAMLIGGVVFGGLEEIGWRGYLLPRLQDRCSALAASMVIGLVWALWHAPLFLMEGTTQTPRSMPWFIVQVVALSVILTWAYNSTRGSVLLVLLAHGALNGWYSAAVQFLAPEALATFMPYAALLMTGAAIAIVARYGPRDLAGRPRHSWSQTPDSS